ncbi:hypothetical protein Hanom_Chr04g00297841 [Helianthus anomalus]
MITYIQNLILVTSKRTVRNKEKTNLMYTRTSRGLSGRGSVASREPCNNGNNMQAIFYSMNTYTDIN